MHGDGHGWLGREQTLHEPNLAHELGVELPICQRPRQAALHSDAFRGVDTPQRANVGQNLAGRLKKPRVTMPILGDQFRHGLRTATRATGGLALASPLPVLLARLPRADRLGVEKTQMHRVLRALAITLHAQIGELSVLKAPQDLRDRRLAHSEGRGNLVLRLARHVAVEHLHFAKPNATAWLLPAFAAMRPRA